MARPLTLAAALTTLGLLAYAGLQGCSADDADECSKDGDCSSASTGCTVGVCRDGACAAQPVPDGTRLTDQSSVKDKPCVVLKCKAGVPTETADGSKTPEPIACKKLSCDGTALKTDNIADGVPCEGGGACRAGSCIAPVDSGPPADTGAPSDTGAPADTATADDAASD